MGGEGAQAAVHCKSARKRAACAGEEGMPQGGATHGVCFAGLLLETARRALRKKASIGALGVLRALEVVGQFIVWRLFSAASGAHQSREPALLKNSSLFIPS